MTLRGIAAAGNWIIDHVKIVDRWPAEETLATIISKIVCNGGAPYNVLKDLARLGCGFPLFAIGLIGDDDHASLIEADCRSHGIDTRGLVRRPRTETAYTDVVSVSTTGRRTFFHHRGANAFFDVDHVDVEGLEAKFFHLGYLLLLDALDRPDPVYGTRAARLLAAVSRRGILTSVDVVSEDSDRFPDIVLPALPYADILSINEYEAGRILQTEIRNPDGTIEMRAAASAASCLLEHGVRKLVVVHYPEGAVAVSTSGEVIEVRALPVPKEEVLGTNGAGDAFTAGLLFGLHEERSLSDALDLARRVAAHCVTDPTPSQGIHRMR
jgi:sugar/nucleoside kinase (ribokinase family)